MPPLVVAKVMQLVKDDRMEIAEAINKVTEDAIKEQQKAQEEAAAQQQATMTPGQMMAPGAMEAMAGPGAAAAMQSPIPGAGQGMEDLGAMLGALRRPAMTVAPMRGVERGAV
jgi:hypothetical protein